MSKVYEYIVSIKDNASKAFEKINGSFSKTVAMTGEFQSKGLSSITSVNNRLSMLPGISSTATRSISSLNEELQRAQRRRSVAIDTNEVRRANGDIRRIQSDIQRLENLPPRGFLNNLNEATGSIGNLVKGVIAFKAASGVFNQFQGVVKLGADLESTRVAFDTMLGSAEKSRQVIGDLNQFANVTPFTNDEVLTAGRNLLAFGTSTDKLMPKLKMIGDVSAGLNIPFNELSETFGKIEVSGLVQGEDLRQLAGRGIPIFEELAKVMGVSASEIRKLGSEGKISTDIMNQAFVNMTSEGGTFFNMMEKQSATFNGKWSTIMGKIGDISARSGEQMLSPFKDVMDGVINLIDSNSSRIVSFAGKVAGYIAYGFSEIGNAISVVSSYFNQIWNSINPLIQSISQLFSALFASSSSVNALGESSNKTAGFLSFLDGVMKSLVWGIDFASTVLETLFKFLADNIYIVKIATIAIVGFKVAFAILNAVMAANPVSLVVIAIISLVSALIYAYQKVGWFRGGIEALFAVVSEFASIIKETILKSLEQILTGINGVAAALTLFFKGEFKKAWEVGKKSASEFSKGILNVTGPGLVASVVKNSERLGEAAVNGYQKGIDKVNSNKGNGFSIIPEGLKGGDSIVDQDDVFDSLIPDGQSNQSLSEESSIKKGTESITGGGSKQTNITINLGKLNESITVNAQKLDEGIEEIEDKMIEMLLRIVNSANYSVR